MDFTAAIQAHTDWKLRLLGYCRGTVKEKLDVATLAKDNVCQLGGWLAAERPHHASDPVFQQLTEAHRVFHQIAASVGRLVENGQAPKGEAILQSPESEFNNRSREVVGLLMKLRNRDSGSKAP